MDTLVNVLAELFCKAGNWLIVVFAIGNIVAFCKTKRAIKVLENMFAPKGDKVNGVSASMIWDNEQISELKKKRKKMVKSYTWYANLTAIFPLLGILGTVAALVTYSDITMEKNLMVALSTTLLGVLCAIFFKVVDAELSGPLDIVIDDADHVIQEYDEEKRRKNEA
ncbi:MAG: MotA/TolQ/ExbB proton channel family protein [Alistipes sp.]|nr:MotA/TolQ/ExbB proton channel family protein [Alistipes sp.]